MGLGRRTFAPGEVLTASNVMNYLQDQSVMSFAGTAARGSAIGTAVQEGMVSYLQDTNFLQVHDGTAWRSVGGVQVASGTAARDALLPSPVQGDKVFRSDLGYEQTYYGAYNSSTNPGGRSVAGWYGDQRNIGLTPIVPPTVAVSGGAATANTLGTISFSAVTSLSLNSVFTSVYQNYRVVLNVNAVSVAADLNMRLRSAGTDTTGTAYNTGLAVIKVASIASYGVTAGDHWFLTNLDPTNRPVGARGSFEIQNPQLAFDTTMQSQFAHYFSGKATDVGGSTIDATTSYDGFTIYPSTGNMTGVVTVYGYNS